VRPLGKALVAFGERPSNEFKGVRVARNPAHSSDWTNDPVAFVYATTPLMLLGQALADGPNLM
jgi:hypothetical protein